MVVILLHTIEMRRSFFKVAGAARGALLKTKLIFLLETLTPYFEHNLKRQKELDYLQCTELILIVR